MEIITDTQLAIKTKKIMSKKTEPKSNISHEFEGIEDFA